MKNLYPLLFALSLVSNSCRNSDTPIDGFFETLEKSVDSNELMTFKNAPRDSALFYFRRFEGDFFKIYRDTAQIVVLNNFFDGIHTANYTETRVYYLCFAFHSKLNYKKFNNDEIIQDVDKEFLKIKDEWGKKAKLVQLDQYKIMQTNNNRWNIGSTFSVILPVKFEGGIKSACYCYNRPLGLDCNNFDDSLKINGILLQKKYYTYPDSGKIDTNEIVFKLKILKLSNPKYRIFDEKYKVGDSLKVHLSAYSKLIL